MAETNGNSWKTYFLGVFFTIIMALSSLGYASVTSRITNLENDQKTAQAVAQQTAVLSEKVDRLSKDVQELAYNEKMTAKEVGDLKIVILSNTKIYKDSIARWINEMNKRK